MYDWVYIYEFEGNIRDKIPSLVDEDYIGFWKEAGYSFLFFKKEKKKQLEKLLVPFRSELVIRHEDWESGMREGKSGLLNFEFNVFHRVPGGVLNLYFPVPV